MENKEATIIEKIDDNRTYVYFKNVSHGLLQRLFTGGGAYVKRNYAFPGTVQLHPTYKSIVVVENYDDAMNILNRYKEWVNMKKEEDSEKDRIS